MKNQEIAEIFERIADILEFKGELPFKLIAYRRAGRNLRNLEEDIVETRKTGRLESIPGVGSALAKKIDQYLSEGHINLYDRLLGEVPQAIIDLLNIQNLGPKTLGLAYERLGVKTIGDLKRVVENGQLASLANIGEKRIENIKQGIRVYEKSQNIKLKMNE